MSGNNTEQTKLNAEKEYNRGEVEEFVGEIERQLAESNNVTMHSMLAVNHLLRQPGARELLDEELVGRVKDVWSKIRSAGLQLSDPPLLYGLPSVALATSDNDLTLDDGTATITFTLPADEPEAGAKSKSSEDIEELDEDEDELEDEEIIEDEESEDSE